MANQQHRPEPASKPPETGSGRIEVVYARPDRQRLVEITLPTSGMTAGEAVEASGLLEEFPELAAWPRVIGIYGVVCEPSRALRNGDRVEIYRPLAHDPRQQRRDRVAADAAARTSGKRAKR